MGSDGERVQLRARARGGHGGEVGVHRLGRQLGGGGELLGDVLRVEASTRRQDHGGGVVCAS